MECDVQLQYAPLNGTSGQPENDTGNVACRHDVSMIPLARRKLLSEKKVFRAMYSDNHRVRVLQSSSKHRMGGSKGFVCYGL
ncbi:hypothetical protein BaRGS_00022824 [Batillaria attramentaria]|uniref:Uncharacterized protein n=1 Tax=Batillaria attramentaria TaxID=370345 RepID=A0ABD0KFZ3_9CAEN